MTDQPAAPLCPGPDPEPRAPRFDPPAGACDAHAHTFPAEHAGRYTPARSYTPPPASLADYLRVLDRLGLARGVLTQPSVYATDNSAILDGVAAAPDRLRAVAAVGQDVTDAELARLDAAGVVGVRVNIVDAGGMPFEDLDAVWRFTERIAPLGWHLELLAHVDALGGDGALLSRLGALPVPVVFGHLGYLKTDKGVDHPAFQRFLELMRGGRAWVKLTGAYRISSVDGPPYPDVAPFAQALLSANPDRVVWGTDWPHPRHHGRMPNDGDLLNQLADWTDDAALRARVLAQNPAALYLF